MFVNELPLFLRAMAFIFFALKIFILPGGGGYDGHILQEQTDIPQPGGGGGGALRPHPRPQQHPPRTPYQLAHPTETRTIFDHLIRTSIHPVISKNIILCY